MNRESARRARIKKQTQLHEILREIDLLNRRNSEIRAKIAEVDSKRAFTQMEIDAVEVEKIRLEQQLNQVMAMVNHCQRIMTR